MELAKRAKDKTLHMLRCTEASRLTVVMGQQ
jgi:hypothetical protein